MKKRTPFSLMTRCALLAGLALTGLVFAGCEGTGAGSGSAAGPASATGEGVVAVAASKAAFVRGGAEHRGVNFGNEEPLKMKGARGGARQAHHLHGL